MQDIYTSNQNIYIGKRVSEARRFRKMSQQELGSHLDLSFQQIQKYEKGQSRISFLSMLSISRILNLPVAYFAQDVYAEISPLPQKLDPESLQLLELYDSLPKEQRLVLLNLIKSLHK